MFSSSKDYDEECARMSDKQLVQHFCHYDRQVSSNLAGASVSSESSGLTLGTALVLASLDGYAAARAQKKRGILGRHIARRGLQGEAKLRGRFDAAVRGGVSLAVAAVFESALRDESESSETEEGEEWDKGGEVEVCEEEVYEEEVYEVEVEVDVEVQVQVYEKHSVGHEENEEGGAGVEIEEEEGEEEEEEEGASESDGYEAYEYEDSNCDQEAHMGYHDTGDAYYESDPDLE